MEKISATTAHSSAHHASRASRAEKSNAPDKTSGQATENRIVEARLDRDEHTKKVIDSRPSQAHLKFQDSLHSTHAKADLKTSS